jgi:hypothetical protein
MISIRPWSGEGNDGNHKEIAAAIGSHEFDPRFLELTSGISFLFMFARSEEIPRAYLIAI